MIIINVQVTVRGEDRQVFLETISADQTIAQQFEGCNRFVWTSDLHSPNQFMLYEEWDSLPAFDAFRTSNEFKASGSKLFPLLAEKPISHYFTGTAFE